MIANITRRFLRETALLLVAGIVFVYVRFRAEISAIRQKVLAGSQLLKTDYGDIEYVVRGTGPPVLLLHGAGGGYDQGLLLGQGMEQKFTLIAVSRFGYLRSPMPRQSSVQAQAALYIALLDYLRLEKVIVVAGSAGGPSAIQFAHDYPERCAALILVSAITMAIVADKDRFHNRVIRLIQKSDFAYWLITKSFQTQFLELIGIPPEVYRRFNREEAELAQKLLDSMHPMSLRYRGSVHEFAIQPLDRAALGDIVTPSLIFHAKDDRLVSYRHAEYAHKHINHSKLVSFDSGGHGLLTQSTRIRECVTAFLADLERKNKDSL